MANVFVVSCVSLPESKRAFLDKDKACLHLRDLILVLKDTSGLSDEDMDGIAWDRLLSEHSTPADWFELSCQWNDWWETEEDMQVLLHEIPLVA